MDGWRGGGAESSEGCGGGLLPSCEWDNEGEEAEGSVFPTPFPYPIDYRLNPQPLKPSSALPRTRMRDALFSRMLKDPWAVMSHAVGQIGFN